MRINFSSPLFRCLTGQQEANLISPNYRQKRTFPLPVFDIFCYKSSVSRKLFIQKSWNGGKVEMAQSKIDCNRVDCCKTDCKHGRRPSMIAMFFHKWDSRKSFVDCCMRILSFCQTLAPWSSRKILQVNFISLHFRYISDHNLWSILYHIIHITLWFKIFYMIIYLNSVIPWYGFWPTVILFSNGSWH